MTCAAEINAAGVPLESSGAADAYVVPATATASSTVVTMADAAEIFIAFSFM